MSSCSFRSIAGTVPVTVIVVADGVNDDDGDVVVDVVVVVDEDGVDDVVVASEKTSF